MRVRRRKDEDRSPGLAPPIGYTVPVGESGASRALSARRTDSIIQVYAFERQHTAFQRIRARRHGRDLTVADQHVTVRTAIGPDHRVVATGGEAVTVLADAQGRQTLLRELAFASDVRRAFLSNASLFFGEGRRILPQFALLDAFAARLRVEGARREVLEARTPGVIEALHEKQGPTADRRREALPSLQASLDGLLSVGRGLLAEGRFDGVRVRVSDETVAQASPAGSPAEGETRLTVRRLAAGAAVASDAAGSDGEALNLEGEFFINDVRIEIEPEDSLRDLMRRINLGEDANGNGVLDNAEDRNFNGVLDPREDANGNGVLDTGEDANGNGALDAGEDLNRNGRLDVSEDRDFDFALDAGLAGAGVKARLEGNRLVVTAETADTPLRFRDPDGILETIGLLTRDARLQQVPKNPVRAAQEAAFDLDGRPRAAPSNAVKDALPSVSLRLLDDGEARVTVERSFAALAADVAAFFDRYNKTLGFLNGLLLRGGLFDAEPAVSRVRQEVGDPVAEDASLAEVGVAVGADPGRLVVHELQMDILLASLRRWLERPFDRISFPRTAANSLASLGINRLDDGLVRFDASAFQDALARDREGVREALVGAGGAVSEVVGALERAVDPETGRLRLLAERLREDPLSAREFERRVTEIFAKHREAAAVGRLADVLG